MSDKDIRSVDARRDAAAQRIEDYVTTLLAVAPPLRPDQIAKLSALFDYENTTIGGESM